MIYRTFLLLRKISLTTLRDCDTIKAEEPTAVVAACYLLKDKGKALFQLSAGGEGFSLLSFFRLDMYTAHLRSSAINRRNSFTNWIHFIGYLPPFRAKQHSAFIREKGK